MSLPDSAPPRLPLGLGAHRRVIAESSMWSRASLGRTPTCCRTGPQALPKASGVNPECLPGTDSTVRAALSTPSYGQGTWGSCASAWAAPASPTQPESHAQHEKGEEKVTITTSATTSPRGHDHLTSTLHTTGGREDGERSLVGLVNREPVLKYRG